MTLKAGTVKDFADSMAEAMEKALKMEWKEVEKVALPEQGEKQRRLLFAAIAQGVVRHLKDNADTAFQIAVETTQSGSGIESKGKVTGANAVQVTQESGKANRVVSKGTATIKQVKIKGTLHS